MRHRRPASQNRMRAHLRGRCVGSRSTVTAVVAAIGVATVGGTGVTVPLAVAEVDIVCNDLSSPTLVAILIGPAADLQPTGHHRHAALGEILGDKFSSLTPSDTVDEVAFPIAAVLR